VQLNHSIVNSSIRHRKRTQRIFSFDAGPSQEISCKSAKADVFPGRGVLAYGGSGFSFGEAHFPQQLLTGGNSVLLLFLRRVIAERRFRQSLVTVDK
jgi:hypothetical protein